MLKEFVEYAFPGSPMILGWAGDETQELWMPDMPTPDEVALIGAIVGVGLFAAFTIKTAGEHFGPLIADAIIDEI